MSYQSASLLDTRVNFNVIWTLSGPISSDTIAGIIAGLQCMINRKNPALALVLQITDLSGKISNINLVLDRISFIDDYLEYRGIPYESLTKYYAPNGYYGWWIFDSTDNTYTLYRFQNDDFIKGFISAFDIFTMEFRNYIAGAPFHTEVGPNGIKQNIFHNIQGYDIRPLIQFRREPAPTGAFYTHTYEEYDRTGVEPEHITDEIDTEYPRDFQ